MKCNALFLTFVFCTLLAQSQNLVPNPSFEEYTICPSNPVDSIEIEKATPWKSYRQTPDFFHPCDETGVMSSPMSSVYGYGVPYHGIGKAGFIGVGGSSTREIIGVQLNEPLIIGESYYVSFYLLRTFGGGGHSNCNCASSHPGLKFTTRSYTIIETIPIDNHAHILNEEVLVDSTNWTQVSGWFVADSAYTHLAIGTFFDNDQVTVENYNNHPGLPKTYYFTDAVCVTADPVDCEALKPVGVVENSFQDQLIVFPNPASSSLSILSDIGIQRYSVIDMTGRIVQHDDLAGEESIDINNLSKGLYILMVRFENETRHNVSFIKQ